MLNLDNMLCYCSEALALTLECAISLHSDEPAVTYTHGFSFDMLLDQFFVILKAALAEEFRKPFLDRAEMQKR